MSSGGDSRLGGVIDDEDEDEGTRGLFDAAVASQRRQISGWCIDRVDLRMKACFNYLI